MIIIKDEVFSIYFLLTLTTFANSQSILVNQIFMTHDIYNDGVTYNIATFSYDQTQQTTPISDAKPSDELSIKLGIISSSNTLVDLLLGVSKHTFFYPT